jgi:hypothetical protein
MTLTQTTTAGSAFDARPDGSWCRECDGRPASTLALIPAASPGAVQAADMAAALGGPTAHVHHIARGDRFAVVLPKAGGR